MKATKILGAVVLTMGVGCGGAALSAAGAQVTLNKADPPSACKEVGSVSTYNIGPGYQEKMKNSLRNDAAEKGANYVRLEQLGTDGNGSGTAFQVPVTSAPS